jgi:tRNA(fMet)-specific endonuclease VapC
MHLLDTNVLTALHAGHPAIVEQLQKLEDSQVGITIVTKVELLKGRIDFLLKADAGCELIRAQALLRKTERSLGEIDIVPFDERSQVQFDRLKIYKPLRKIGRADLLIASIALANRAILVTRNLKDFQRVPELKIANWF